MTGVCSSGESSKQNSRKEQMEKAKVEIRPLSQDLHPLAQPVSGCGRQIYSAAIVSILAMMFGLSVGWPSPVQRILQSDASPVGRLTDEDMSWLASLTFLGGITGSLFWSRIADKYGRKAGGYLIAVPFIVGWGLTSFTSDRRILFAARFINGIGGSGGFILSPTYIGEIAQDSIRGALGSFIILYMNAGILIAYVLGAMVQYDILNYVCLSIPFVFLILFRGLPESPQFLWSEGKKEEAQVSLLWLRSGNMRCVQEESLAYINKNQQNEANMTALVSTRGRRMGMLIGLGLFTWQQFCGILAILSYTSSIFEKSGSSMSPEMATIIVGTFQLISSGVSSVAVDRFGRKILLLISYLFMGLALTTLGGYFYMDETNHDMSTLSWVPVVALSVHVLTYALGAGPVPFVVVSETLPADIRGLATSVIVLVGTLLAFISVKIFPFLITYTGISGCFWFFSIFCYIAFLFTWWVVPETKGVSLQEISSRLNGVRRTDIV